MACSCRAGCLLFYCPIFCSSCVAPGLGGREHRAQPGHAPALMHGTGAHYTPRLPRATTATCPGLGWAGGRSALAGAGKAPAISLPIHFLDRSIFSCVLWHLFFWCTGNLLTWPIYSLAWALCRGSGLGWGMERVPIAPYRLQTPAGPLGPGLWPPKQHLPPSSGPSATGKGLLATCAAPSASDPLTS